MAPKKKNNKQVVNFVVKEQKDAGKVVLAARNLKQGSVVFVEDPIIYVKEITDENISRKFAELEAKQKDKVLSLVPDGNSELSDEEKILSLFRRKNINSQHSSAGQALYYVLSRVKHSCGPNVVLQPQPEKTFGRIEIRACRTILKGEELRADYLTGINLFEPKDVRSRAFGDKFECDCKVCALTDGDMVANESRRKMIKESYRNTSIYVTLGDFVQAFDQCQLMLGHLEWLEQECVPKCVSVTLECWQLAVLAKLQKPDVKADVTKYKERSKKLCQILGKTEVAKWERTEQNIADEKYELFDTIKLRSSGPWAEEIIARCKAASKEEASADQVEEKTEQVAEKIEQVGEKTEKTEDKVEEKAKENGSEGSADVSVPI